MLYYLIDSSLNETSAAFRIKGPDANTYLQGQFTQELNRPIGTVSYGLFLNQKGKVMADGQVLRVGSDEFWLVSVSLAADKLRERLDAYLIADDVSIEDETESWTRIRIWGDLAGGVVAKLIGRIPEPGNWSEAGRTFAFRGRLGTEDNFDLWVPRENAPKIGEKLRTAGAQETDATAAERERIHRGIPAVPADIGLNDLPNEGGLDEVAISYTKGCYLGQEVMARLKNLGQVRRRLHIARGEGVPPTFGATLFQRDVRVGEVRSVAPEGGGFVAMVMLSLVNLRASDGLSLTANGPGTIRITRRV